MDKPNLLRALLDACEQDGTLDETIGRAIEREHLRASAEPTQLTIDGREVPARDCATQGEQGPRCGDSLRLFSAPPTFPGQLAFDNPDT